MEENSGILAGIIAGVIAIAIGTALCTVCMILATQLDTFQQFLGL